MPDPSPRAARTTRPRAAGTGRPLRKAGADDRSRQDRGTARRQQILDAAVELFASKGYRGTGVAALGERVGMTATGLLYYFGSKERLLHEVVAEREIADARDTDLPLTLEGLRALGRHNADTALLTMLYVVLGAESIDPREPLHAFFVDRFDTARHLTQLILENEVAEARVRADVDTEQIAAEVIGTLMGMEIQWLTDPERFDLAKRFEAYIDRLVADLAP